MIKKFQEYFKENFNIENIIPKEEVEDQFLRLEEVLNCPVEIIPVFRAQNDKYNFITTTGGISNRYFIPLYINDNNLEEISKELDQIKRRIEVMFPSIEMEIDKNPDVGTQDNLFNQTYYEVKIKERAKHD